MSRTPIPVTPTTSKSGVLVWDGEEVVSLSNYPGDARWIATAARGGAGGWWVSWHTYVPERGEHAYTASSGPHPRVEVDELLQRHPPAEPAHPQPEAAEPVNVPVDVDPAMLELLAEANKPAWAKEVRKDGWPLCPQCEEDELYSLSEPASIETIVGCYRCSWKPPVGPA